MIVSSSCCCSPAPAEGWAWRSTELRLLWHGRNESCGCGCDWKLGPWFSPFLSWFSFQKVALNGTGVKMRVLWGAWVRGMFELESAWSGISREFRKGWSGKARGGKNVKEGEWWGTYIHTDIGTVSNLTALESAWVFRFCPVDWPQVHPGVNCCTSHSALLVELESKKDTDFSGGANRGLWLLILYLSVCVLVQPRVISYLRLYLVCTRIKGTGTWWGVSTGYRDRDPRRWIGRGEDA